MAAPMQGADTSEAARQASAAMECPVYAMLFFKVLPCPQARSHDWTVCPFFHPQESARRRCLLLHKYGGKPCPDMQLRGACPRGDACHMAHGMFESFCHPTKYRTDMCHNAARCTRRFCFFSHEPSQLRTSSDAPAEWTLQFAPDGAVLDSSMIRLLSGIKPEANQAARAALQQLLAAPAPHSVAANWQQQMPGLQPGPGDGWQPAVPQHQAAGGGQQFFVVQGGMMQQQQPQQQAMVLQPYPYLQPAAVPEHTAPGVMLLPPEVVQVQQQLPLAGQLVQAPPSAVQTLLRQQQAVMQQQQHMQAPLPVAQVPISMAGMLPAATAEAAGLAPLPAQMALQQPAVLLPHHQHQLVSLAGMQQQQQLGSAPVWHQLALLPQPQPQVQFFEQQPQLLSPQVMPAPPQQGVPTSVSSELVALQLEQVTLSSGDGGSACVPQQQWQP